MSAHRFYETKNFFGLCAVMVALHKIKDFDDINSNLAHETQQHIQKYEDLCSFEDNYKALRTEIARTDGKLVPYIGI